MYAKTVECHLIESIIGRCIVTATGVLRRNDRTPVSRYQKAIKLIFQVFLHKFKK